MDAALDMDGGWKEAITNVADLDRWCDLRSAFAAGP